MYTIGMSFQEPYVYGLIVQNVHDICHEAIGELLQY